MHGFTQQELPSFVSDRVENTHAFPQTPFQHPLTDLDILTTCLWRPMFDSRKAMPGATARARQHVISILCQVIECVISIRVGPDIAFFQRSDFETCGLLHWHALATYQSNNCWPILSHLQAINGYENMLLRTCGMYPLMLRTEWKLRF